MKTVTCIAFAATVQTYNPLLHGAHPIFIGQATYAAQIYLHAWFQTILLLHNLHISPTAFALICKTIKPDTLHIFYALP